MSSSTLVIPVTGPERKWWEDQGCWPVRVSLDLDTMTACVRGRDYQILRDRNANDCYVVTSTSKARNLPSGYFSPTRVYQTISIEVCRDLKAIRAALLGLPYTFVVAHCVAGGYVHPDGCSSRLGQRVVEKLYTAKNLPARCLVCDGAFE